MSPATHRFLHDTFAMGALLVLLAAAAYANAPLDVLVFDDRYFVVAERFANLSWSSLVQLFREDLWAGYGADSGLYRPLFAVLIAAEWLLFSDWAAGYHLTNIALHAFASLLVFFLLRRVLTALQAAPARASLAALLAAAVFAAHPLHAEAINSVFNSSELWATIAVVGGLLWLLRHGESHPLWAWSGLALIYFLGLLIRESAVVLPGLAAILLWFLGPGNWHTRLRRAAPIVVLAIPLAVYLVLRVTALQDAETASDSAVSGILDSALSDQAGRLLGPDRWIPWAQTWSLALKLWVWPHPLMLLHNFGAAPAWLAVLSNALLMAVAIYLLWRNRPGLFLGLAVFYVALLPIVVFMGRYAGTVALNERFLYLPSVGLTLVVAIALLWLARHAGPRAALGIALVTTVVLVSLTWARNGDWSSNLRLFEAEYHHGRADSELLGQIVQTHLATGDFAQAVRYCDRYAAGETFTAKFAESCGLTYQRLGRMVDAERALLQATGHWTTAASAQKYLAELYLASGRSDRARELYALAVEREKLPAMKELRQAEMIFALHRDDPGRMREALAHVERALELQPRLVQAMNLRDRINGVPPRPARTER